MPLIGVLITENFLLLKRLGDFESEYGSRDSGAADDEAGRWNNEKFVTILKDNCAVIRKGDSSNGVHLKDLFEVRTNDT